jgi:hypothetical protein
VPSDILVGGIPYRYDGFWWRCLAALIDSMIASPIGRLVVAVLGLLMAVDGRGADPHAI